MTRYTSTKTSSAHGTLLSPLPSLARHAEKLKARRASTWPRLSSSFSPTSFSSEQEPRYTSAHFVGGNSLAPFLLDARNDKDTKSEERLSNGRGPSRNSISNNMATSSVRVVPSGNTHDWIVTRLLPVPLYYPLERGCITVEKQVPLSVICKRISDFLRMNSISCHYNNTRVDCQTMGLLKFAIYLWKASPNGGTLVEIQRRQGCSIAMHQYKCGLVQAITTGKAPTIEQSNAFPVECLDTAFSEAHDTANGDCKSTLKICMRMLETDQHDQQRLGMESLVALTNPQTVFASHAKLVCRALVLGEGGESLQCIFLPYFQDNERTGQKNLHSVDYDSDSDDDDEEYAQGCHFGSMHNLALQALANALQVVADLENDDSTAQLSLACPFWNTVCNALVYNVEVAHYRPREAALSAKCLNLLAARLAPVLCNCPLVLDRLAPVLPEANEYGKACNLLLERESHKLMGTLAEGH